MLGRSRRRILLLSPHIQHSNSQTTYTRELDAAVAALGGSAALLDVKNAEGAAGSLDNPRQVRRGVVPAGPAELAMLPLSRFLRLPIPNNRSENTENSRVPATVGDS
jgi:hypothetical protein